ncbi:CDP-diacylglycerol--serine O-phosphatidyltransferase [Methanocaldococcus indicus]|uniref:CDP-diacylglycerol--serine O-phosphatidyltransferase n=1 Tax=Methanocaldococcus indicus TaxID=213231 RepID=UPI003C6D5C65
MFSIKKLITISDYITMLNTICGFLSIIYMIPNLIYLAIIFDALDGYIARKTNTVSELGKELDSLSDIVSFGVAPAYLLYNDNNILLIGCIIFLLCGMLRLARFNIIKTEGFIGLPIPAAALILISTQYFIKNTYFLLFLSIFLGLLMISDIRYPKSKNKVVMVITFIALILGVFNIPYLALILGYVYLFLGIYKLN